jgi:group I intron endonuclease
MCKYGTDNFKVEILENVIDENLDERETYYINTFNTLVPNGYNIQVGGQGKGRQHCEVSRKLMSESKLGEKNPNFGKPRTDETKAKISNAKKGEKHHFYGKTLTLSHREKLSKSHKSDDLPMYICHVPARPKIYCDEGYVVIHPNLPRKYFTSKKLSIQQKLDSAKEYLNSINMSPVQRLDGDG